MTDPNGLVAKALRNGARIVWDPVRYRGPSSALALAKQAADIAREVLRRAEIFRDQLHRSDEMPFLTLSGSTGSGCLSCGDEIDNGFRCDVCQFAVLAALDLIAGGLDG